MVLFWAARSLADRSMTAESVEGVIVSTEPPLAGVASE